MLAVQKRIASMGADRAQAMIAAMINLNYWLDVNAFPKEGRSIAISAPSEVEALRAATHLKSDLGVYLGGPTRVMLCGIEISFKGPAKWP